MAHLFLSFLGSFRVMLDGRPVDGFESSKVRALLAYLAVESDRPHSRDALAGLLWPNQTEQAAHACLSQALANLRRAIGDSAARPPFLNITRDSIQFNTASDHALDVAEFSGLLTAWKSHVHRRAETCRPCAQRLQAAADLYRGDFLEEFFLRGNERFEEWVLLKRERLRQLALEAMYHCAEYDAWRGDYEQAYQHAARQIELDSWREEAYRQAMRALALSGQRNAALAQYESVRRIVNRELGVEPTAETTTLHEQIKDGSLIAPNRLSRDQHHGLPTNPTPFVGREDELVHLVECLENPDCRLLTLTGPGGIGKTRLAVEVVTLCAESFAQGARFVSVTELSSAEFLVPAIANALDLALYSATEPTAQLLSHLREKDLLLVLDGFERLSSAAGLFANIIQQVPKVVLLVTSRERLGLQAEWVFDVSGLEYPRGKSASQIEAYSAVKLFVQRAHMARVRFSLSQDNAPHVARICQLVEGMPLALELAAAWLSVLSCKDIAREIEQNLSFLAAERHDIPLRHRSMRAVFDRSWDSLSTEEKSVFRRLSAFRRGFSKEAAERRAGASASLLAALVDKSLVRRLPAGRYKMHELIRRFADKRLQEAADEERRLVSATAQVEWGIINPVSGTHKAAAGAVP